jgi:ferritin
MKFITQEVIDLLNYRIQQEQYSSKIYEQMYLYLANESFFNAAKVWKKFSEEELSHAEWAKDYLMSFNIMPELMQIDEPPNNFSSIEDIIQQTFDHEVLVTQQCLDLTKKAFTLQDFTLLELGLKFNKEQKEEMDKAYGLLDVMRLTSDKLILDKYIGENF